MANKKGLNQTWTILSVKQFSQIFWLKITFENRIICYYVCI